jgi:hypothetical protein
LGVEAGREGFVHRDDRLGLKAARALVGGQIAEKKAMPVT